MAVLSRCALCHAPLKIQRLADGQFHLVEPGTDSDHFDRCPKRATPQPRLMFTEDEPTAVPCLWRLLDRENA